jgi:hypothetical protein
MLVLKSDCKISKVTQTKKQSCWGKWRVVTGSDARIISVHQLRGGGNIPIKDYFLIPCTELCNVWKTADKNTMCTDRFSKLKKCRGDGFYVRKNFRRR